MIKRYSRKRFFIPENLEVCLLRNRVNYLEGIVRRMNTQLRVAQEDIILLEKGITADIERLEKRL